MIRHGSVSEQRVGFCMFSRSSARLGRREGCWRAAEVEGSPSRSRLKICVTAGITETAAEKNPSCVLPERRRAMWSGPLMVDTHKEKFKLTWS